MARPSLSVVTLVVNRRLQRTPARLKLVSICQPAPGSFTTTRSDWPTDSGSAGPNPSTHRFTQQYVNGRSWSVRESPRTTTVGGSPGSVTGIASSCLSRESGGGGGGFWSEASESLPLQLATPTTATTDISNTFTTVRR